MARGEVWNEVNTLFRIGGFKIVEARLFVAQDDTRPLPDAFQMLVSLRILGAQVDNDAATNNFHVTNGPVSVPIVVSTFEGKVDGQISGWQGVTANGSSSTDGAWKDAEHVRFTLAALARLTVPVADIIAIVPGIGFILRALLKALPGQQVSFTVGTIPVDIPIHRLNGAVVLPDGAVNPPWWP